MSATDWKILEKTIHTKLNDSLKKNEYKTNLKTLSKVQLTEILGRQKKLVANRKALAHLPDKGEKVLRHLKEIEEELKFREEKCDISDALAGLSLKQLDGLEWTNSVDGIKKVENEESKVDVEEQNPFRILANHSGAGFHKKDIRVEPKEKSLVTERDLEDLYAQQLCSKVDHVEPRERFLPYKTLNTAKALSNKPRDLSSAAPPLSKFGDTKLLGLEDSLKLLMKQNENLSEIKLQHAAERLKDKTYKIGETLPSEESTQIYRETIEPDEENEVRDECEGHDGGDVRFPIDFDEVD